MFLKVATVYTLRVNNLTTLIVNKSTEAKNYSHSLKVTCHRILSNYKRKVFYNGESGGYHLNQIIKLRICNDGINLHEMLPDKYNALKKAEYNLCNIRAKIFNSNLVIRGEKRDNFKLKKHSAEQVRTLESKKWQEEGKGTILD